jgi:signal transduction histidine kinase
MSQAATPAGPGRPPPVATPLPPAPPPAERSAADSAFEASAFERILGTRSPTTRWIGWRRRLLVLAALLGCLGVFSLARWVAGTPQLDGRWASGAGGQLVLQSHPLPALEALHGQALRSVAVAGQPPLQVDALLLHRSPRWQVDDAVRARQVAQHESLAALLAQAAQSGQRVQLAFANGTSVELAVAARGYAGLGLLFWPLAGLGLLLYLFAVVVLLARPQPRNLLYTTMTLCQAGNLLFMALETTRGLGLPAGTFSGDMPIRGALDLITAAAVVHAFALHPRPLARARDIAAVVWAGVLAWLVLAHGGHLSPLWWWAQGACLALGAAALAIVSRSHRVEPNPYALVMRRFAMATMATLVLATVAVAIAARNPAAAPGVAAGASVAWYLFFASLLLLTPFLARSRQVLREFAMLAGISTVATSLDLLFVAIFSLGPFTSLAVAVFIALGLYTGARQWMLNHLIGSSMLTTERTFDQIYRAARAVQAKPARYPQQLGLLLKELFEPLEMLRVDRVPVRTRVIGGGSALVVPMRSAADDAGGPSAALVLRFAYRGQRLFTLDDARLADRVVDQLRRAVAYDTAVERGRFEERLRIAQDLHDDIGARLLTLMYQAQTPEMEDYIRHTLQDLKTLTRGLAAAEHRLSHAAAEWKADLTQRLTAAHVTLHWQFNADRDLRLSVVQWSALTRVLRELVSNALYHGHASRIDVSFQLEGPQLRLWVADDGRGRDPQAWSHGLGMGGVRKRVKALAGEVSWRENQPRGIVCEVRVAQFAERQAA